MPSTGAGSSPSPRPGPPPRRRAWCRPGSRAEARAISCLPTTRPAPWQLLADAGFPGGAGFPAVTLLGGGGTDRAFAAEVEKGLGVTIQVEIQGPGFFDRLRDDPPEIFAMGWIADYPGANDFLGILLGTRASNNYGRWSSAPFDRAVGDALAAADPSAARAAFDRAEGIVRDDAPTIPLTYEVGWSLARSGLLGAYDSGLGIIRMAGLAWDRGRRYGPAGRRCRRRADARASDGWGWLSVLQRGSRMGARQAIAQTVVGRHG